MTPLRQRMSDDMQVRNLAPHTQRSYLQQVSQFARRFGKSPELLGPGDIRAYQLHLTRDKHLSASSILVAVAAIRFLYKVTLRRDWDLEDVIPSCRKSQTLPVVMSPEEVSWFLDAVGSLKHRVILTVWLYGWTAGVRGRPPDAGCDRQPTHGDPRGGGQRAQGPLRHAVAQAPGHPPGLLAQSTAPAVAVPRRPAGTTDLDGCRGGCLQTYARDLPP